MDFPQQNILSNSGENPNQGSEMDMEGWEWDQEAEDAVVICCEIDGIKYRIIGDWFRDESVKKDKNIILVKELLDKQPELNCRFKEAGITASVLLFEWENYYLEIMGDNEARDKDTAVFVGDVKLHKPMGSRYYLLQFKNQLGKTVITAEKRGKKIALPEIEVISRKLWPAVEGKVKTEDPLFYLKFYQAIVDSLKEHCLSLAFYLLAPTYLGAVEELRPPSPLFIFHYFKRNWEEIRNTFSIIVHQPYKRLFERDNFVRISEVNTIDNSVIYDIITHPERWEEVKGESPILLAEKLKDVKSKRRYLPTIVLQREKYETYDVPENRFAKFFLQMLINELNAILNYYRKELEKNEFEEIRKNFEDLKDFLMSIQMRDVFVEAGEMQIFPANSTVLQRRDGYRELLRLYREFLLSRCPLFEKIEEALSARDIATLYEYWCFFEIGKILGEILSVKELKLFWDATGGLEGGGKTYFEFESEKNKSGKCKLIYNKKFGRVKKESYSVSLRPDFSLEINGKQKIVLDAKFRFDEKDVEGKIEGNKEIDEEMEKARKEGDSQLVAKLEDIFKMHTYKDALKLRAAFIVFPGTNWCLFEENSHKRYPEEKVIEDLSPYFSGIGYIPLVPKQKTKEEKEKKSEKAIFDRILRKLLGKEV